MNQKDDFILIFYATDAKIKFIREHDENLFVTLKNDSQRDIDSPCIHLEKSKAIELRDFLNYCYPKE